MDIKIAGTDTKSEARAGEFLTSNGRVETPVFMPVGTLGTVKAISPLQLKNLGASIILGNTYHLHLRPGSELVRDLNGLHDFIGWKGAILTDSGGFQIFSLQDSVRISEEGVQFQSHIDGSKHFITPEKSIQIQQNLGSDIMMVLDHLLPSQSESADVKIATERTIQWAHRCKKEYSQKPGQQHLFAIQQGGLDKRLRLECLERLVEMDFSGYAIGGLSVGEPKEKMYEIAEYSAPFLPADRPRYIMGVGTPADLLTFVSFGYDMFDCVLPTRMARTGKLFTATGTLVIKNSQYKKDASPLDDTCGCYTCSNFSRAYLRHLFLSREILGIMLNTHHNLHFYLNFMAQIRQSIIEGSFDTFRNDFLRKYDSG